MNKVIAMGMPSPKECAEIIDRPANNKNGKLAPMQQRFIEQYMKDLNGKQAALRAGYAPRSAEMQASRMLSTAKVKTALQRLMEARARDTARGAMAVVNGLWENHARAMQIEPVLDRNGVKTGEYVYAGSVANRALELLGKHLGMFVDRVDHTGEITIEAIRRTIVDPNDT
jgi:phage terminase small subunit